MEIKTVGIACDHAGFPLKKFVIQYLEAHKLPYKDFGCNSDLRCDIQTMRTHWQKRFQTVKYILPLLFVVVVKV